MQWVLAVQAGRIETMGRFFAIALALVAPVAAGVALRRRRRRRATVSPEPSGTAGPTTPDAPAVDDGVRDLAWLVARIDGLASDPALDGTGAEIAVPAALQPAGGSLDHLVIDDTVRRNGLVAEWSGGPDGAALRLRRPTR